MFKNNTGMYFLDRTNWAGWMQGNALSDSTVGDTSERRYNYFYDGTNLRFYTDDAGTSITL